MLSAKWFWLTMFEYVRELCNGIKLDRNRWLNEKPKCLLEFSCDWVGAIMRNLAKAILFIYDFGHIVRTVTARIHTVAMNNNIPLIICAQIILKCINHIFVGWLIWIFPLGTFIFRMFICVYHPVSSIAIPSRSFAFNFESSMMMRQYAVIIIK